MGFLKSKKVGNNFERDWASSTFKPQAEQLSQAGQGGLQSLLAQLQGTDNGLGFQNYQQSTGYNNILNDAMRGVSGSAAARGLLNSGSTARALQTRASQLGQQSYGNYLQQLLGGSQAALGAGQNAANTVLGANTYTRQGGLNNFLQSAGQLASGIGSMIPRGG